MTSNLSNIGDLHRIPGKDVNKKKTLLLVFSEDILMIKKVIVIEKRTYEENRMLSAKPIFKEIASKGPGIIVKLIKEIIDKRQSV